MALGILAWDLPPEEQIETYNEKARTAWIPTVLKQPGARNSALTGTLIIRRLRS